MKTPHEPLTSEERALAQSLSRLGPHGDPSPDLDARILGAARAAVQDVPARGDRVPPARRRWPLGMGVAASVLLAAGIAWQLRPTHEVPVASEVPVAEAQHSVDLATPEAEVAATDAAAAPVSAAPPPPPAAVAEDAAPPRPAKALPAAPAAPARKAEPPNPARRNAEAAARQEAAPKRSPLALIPAVPDLISSDEAATSEPRATPQAFPAEADSYSPPPPAAAASDASDAATRAQAQQRAAAQQQQEQRVRQDEDPRAAAAKAADSRTLDSISVTGSRVRKQESPVRTQSAAPAPATVPPPAPPAPPAPAASAGSVQPSAARSALRRTDLQVPVDEDTRLPPEEWLERIRLRRDLGDDANALRSLQLFVQEHPFQRIPDDLRPLLGRP